MKKPKVDKFGVGMSVAFGTLSWLFYKCGKGQGRLEAFNEVADELKKLAEEASKNSNE